MPRLGIVTWHGEHRTVYYLVDFDALEDEQPAVLDTFETYKQAVEARGEQEHDEAHV